MVNWKKRAKQSRLWKKEKDGSKELTDQQLVAKARARARGLPLMVDDLFEAIGFFNNIFWKAILLNSILWSLGALQYATISSLSDSTKNYEFQDMNGMVYTTRGDITNHADKDLGQDQYGESVRETLKTISDFSKAFGPMYIWIRRKVSLKRMMLESCLLYMVACTLFYFSFSPVFRLGVIFTSFFSKPMRYVSFIHLASSVPTRLLPMAMGCMLATDTVFSVLHELILLNLTNWKYNQLTLGVVVGFAGIAYAIFVPSPILMDMVEKRGANIEACIKGATKADAGEIDVDALIDDTLFKGQATISPWKKAMAMLGIGSFRWKYIALLLLINMETWSVHSGRAALTNGSLLTRTPATFLKSVMEGLGSLMSIVFLYQFGRRFTITFHILLTLGTLAVLLSIRTEAFDICATKSAPSAVGKVLSAIAGLLLHYASRVLKITVRLVTIQHIPVEQHTILFTLGMVFFNAFREILVAIQNARWAQWEDPYREHSIHFGLILLFAPLLLVVDNCATMPLVSSDYLAYQTKRKQYQNYPQLNDDEEGKGTYEGTTEPTS